MQEAYRSAASILLLCSFPVAGGDPVYKLLLLHKPRRHDAWQLPQGGVEDGESIEDAALRELYEEAHIRNVRFLGVSKEVYQYDFPSSYRRFRPDHIRGQEIRYVFGLVSHPCAVTVDSAEIDGCVWAFPEELGRYIRRREYSQCIRRLLSEARLCLQSSHPS